VKAVQDTTVLTAFQEQIGASVGEAGSAWELLKQVLGYMYMEILTVPSPVAARTVKGTGEIVPRAGVQPPTRDQVDSIPAFFVKPMCTFALPPACNIVFPSMLQNFSHEEDYRAQPTRLYMCEHFISDIVAPKAGSVRNFAQELMVTGYPNGVRKRMKDLLSASPEANNKAFLRFPEELFIGPRSKQLNAPPWMYMLSQQGKGKDTEVSPAEKAIMEAAIVASVKDGSASVLGALFDQYAKYEFFRARYAARNGGMSLAWDPFIVPGLPVAVFDRDGDGFEMMGYANTVSHVMSAGPQGTMATQVGLTFLRTMPEFLGLVGEEVLESATQSVETPTPSEFFPDEEAATPQVADISPPEVIPDVRKYFQFVDTTKDLYRRMLYGGGVRPDTTVFDWSEMFNVKNQYGDVLDLNTEAWKLDPYVSLSPKEEYRGLFDNYDAAMRFVARPGCSLKEYIETWHEKPLQQLLEEGTVAGETRSFYGVAGDKSKQKGAVFWTRIYTLVQGPGPTPAATVTNMGPAPDYASAGKDALEFVDRSTGMPETRQDWDTILLEYRKIIRKNYGQEAPQK